MSQRDLTLSDMLICLADREYSHSNTNSRQALEILCLKQYKQLFLELHYSKSKSEMLKQLIEKSESNLRENELLGHDSSHRFKEICKSNKSKAQNDLNEELSKIEEISTKLKKLETSKPIQDIVIREFKFF